MSAKRQMRLHAIVPLMSPLVERAEPERALRLTVDRSRRRVRGWPCIRVYAGQPRTASVAACVPRIAEPLIGGALRFRNAPVQADHVRYQSTHKVVHVSSIGTELIDRDEYAAGVCPAQDRRPLMVAGHR